ncbi:uncharacterized protein LOC144118947 [Amblyomma americanum]
MAHSKPVPDAVDRGCGFLAMFAACQTEMQQRRLRQLAILDELEERQAEQEQAERTCRRLQALAARLCSRERSVWTYPRETSWYETTLPHLPESGFRENFRMTRSTFQYIVGVCECMKRRDTNMRKAIPLRKRVAIAIYRLATSAEERTVANVFGVSRSSVNNIVREFCDTMVEVLEPRYIKMPRTHELAEHLRQFAAVAGFPQGVGAVDGCHIEVCPPLEHAVDYHNYKGWYSTILLAVADHRYKFLYTNSGSPGRNHDAAVFEVSRLPKILDSDLFKREVREIEGVQIGPLFLADQAFPLQKNVMKPFPHSGIIGSDAQEFNFRLSSARRVVENAFGRLKARFRILLKGLECDIVNVPYVIRACCVLHNICEELTDSCDSNWLDVVHVEDRRRPQPVCTSSQVEPSGVAVRNALAKHLASK